MEKEIIGNWGFEYFAIIHHQHSGLTCLRVMILQIELLNKCLDYNPKH